MKQAVDKNSKQKTINRLQRLAEKLHSKANNPFESKLPTAKNQLQAEQIQKEKEGGFDKTKCKAIQEFKAAKLQQLRLDLHSPTNKIRREKKIPHYKSQDGLAKRLLTNPENVNSINYIMQTAEQYRKDLIQNNERKAKISMQAAVAKKQIEIAEREKEFYATQNRQLKNDIIVLQKELLVSKESQERIKRKYQIQIYEKNSQIQQNKMIIAELKDDLGKFKNRTQRVMSLQSETDKLKNERARFNQELQKLKESNKQWQEKNKIIEFNYKQLMQYNAKLQVNSESLSKELNITKEYLSKTQLLLSTNKQENYKNNEERLKQIEQRAATIAALNNQVVLLSNQNEEICLNLLKRQATITELQNQQQLQKINTKNILLQKSKLQQDITSLQKKLSGQQKLNKKLGSQLQEFKKLSHVQTAQSQGLQQTIQQMIAKYKNNELQLIQSFEEELKAISAQNSQQVANMQNELSIAENRIKDLVEFVAVKEKENQNLKEILKSKQQEISHYFNQIKQNIQRQNNIKQQAQKSLQREAKLSEELNHIQQMLNRSFEQLNEQKNQKQQILKAKETELIFLKQGLLQKQNNMKSVQIEIIKQQQMVEAFINTKDYVNKQQIIEITSKAEYYEKAFKDQSAKNQQLSSAIAAKEAENFKYSIMIQEIQRKIRNFQDQIQKSVGQQKGDQGQRKVKLYPEPQRALNSQQNCIKSIDEILASLIARIQRLKSQKDKLYNLNNQLNQDNGSKFKLIQALDGKLSQKQQSYESLSALHVNLQTKLLDSEAQKLRLLNQVADRQEQLQKTKREMIILEAQMKELYEQNLNECQEKFKKKVEELDSEKVQLIKQLEILKPYKIKSEELQSQMTSLSHVLKNESLKNEAQRNKSNSLLKQLFQLRKTHKSQMQKFVAQHNYQLQNLTQFNKKQKDELKRHVENLINNSQKLKMDLQALNAEFVANNIKKKSLFLQLEALKIISNTEYYEKFEGQAKEMTTQSKVLGMEQKSELLQTNDEIQRTTHVQRVSDAIKPKEKPVKSGFGLHSLILIEKDLTHAQSLLDSLKEERELFIKKYIFITNNLNKSSQIERTTEMANLGINFNRISTIHTELNQTLVKIRSNLPNKIISVIKSQKVDTSKTQE